MKARARSRPSGRLDRDGVPERQERPRTVRVPQLRADGPGRKQRPGQRAGGVRATAAQLRGPARRLVDDAAVPGGPAHEADGAAGARGPRPGEHGRRAGARRLRHLGPAPSTRPSGRCSPSGITGRAGAGAWRWTCRAQHRPRPRGPRPRAGPRPAGGRARQPRPAAGPPGSTARCATCPTTRTPATSSTTGRSRTSSRPSRPSATIDLIGFDACLMGDAGDRLRTCAMAGSVMVASEELEPGDGWNYENFLRPLAADPAGVDAAELGRLMVAGYAEALRRPGRHDAVGRRPVPGGGAARAVSRFATHAADDTRDHLPALRRARQACDNYAPGYGLHSIDLGRFLDQVTRAPGVDPRWPSGRATARDAVDAMVIENYASTRARAVRVERGGHLLPGVEARVRQRPRPRRLPPRQPPLPGRVRRPTEMGRVRPRVCRPGDVLGIVRPPSAPGRVRCAARCSQMTGDH